MVFSQKRGGQMRRILKKKRYFSTEKYVEGDVLKQSPRGILSKLSTYLSISADSLSSPIIPKYSSLSLLD